MLELLSPAVVRALAALPPGSDPLEVASRLRAALGPALGPRAAELHALRAEAGAKLARPEAALLTRKGLEQATALPVARARAGRIAAVLAVPAQEGPVVDATAGIGGDASALAEAGLPVVAVEREATSVLCLAHNLALAGAPGRTLRGDATRLPLRPGFLLLDPDRRPEHTRAQRHERWADPERWSPALGRCLELLAAAPAGALKLPPALEPRAHGLERPGTSLQWVSLAGELKELVLWTGAAAGEPGERAVLALAPRGARDDPRDDPGSLARAELRGRPEPDPTPLSPAAAALVPWIAEPDPAVLRAGLLPLLARTEGLAPLGPGLAYLGGEAPARHALLASWRVLGSAPLDRRHLRRLLAEHDVGPLTVKKRGHPESAETLAERFRGPGRTRGLLLVARLERGHRAYLLARPT